MVVVALLEVAFVFVAFVLEFVIVETAGVILIVSDNVIDVVEAAVVIVVGADDDDGGVVVNVVVGSEVEAGVDNLVVLVVSDVAVIVDG